MSTDRNIVKAATLLVLLFTIMLGFTASPEVLAAPEASTVPVAPVEPAPQAQTNPDREAQQMLEQTIKRNFMPDSMGTTAIAIMGIVGVFIAPAVVVILIVWLWFRHNSRKEQMKFDTLRLMVEKGVPIPEKFSFVESAPAPGASLRRGLILIALGIGIVCFFLIVGANEGTALGAIPFFIGLAYLLIWYLERNKARSDEQAG